MTTAIETTSEKYCNKAIRQLLQHAMIIICLVQMFSGFMDSLRSVKGAAMMALTVITTAATA
jgi:hypothetical protein